jgi:hypothetical protein
MVTDTAPFRYPYYHSSGDTPDKLDYDRFTLVVSGMEKVLEDLDKLEPKSESQRRLRASERITDRSADG